MGFSKIREVYNNSVCRAESWFTRNPRTAPLKYIGLVVGVPLLAQGALQVAPAVADTLGQLSPEGHDLLVKIADVFSAVCHDGTEKSLLSVVMDSSSAHAKITAHSTVPFRDLVMAGVNSDGTTSDVSMHFSSTDVYDYDTSIRNYLSDSYSSYIAKGMRGSEIVAQASITDGDISAAGGNLRVELSPVFQNENAFNYWPIVIVSSLAAIGAGITVWFKKRKRKDISRDKDITNIVR